MFEYDKEKWVEVYQAALLELKQSLMAGRIADASAEIVKRIEALREIPGQHKEERQAIEDALNTLQFLKREDAEITADNERKEAAAALDRLLEILPKARPQEES